jgi:hypothetical protein
VDYLGATRAGMQAMLFDIAGTYRESGLPRVESLQELTRVLTTELTEYTEGTNSKNQFL